MNIESAALFAALLVKNEAARVLMYEEVLLCISLVNSRMYGLLPLSPQRFKIRFVPK